MHAIAPQSSSSRLSPTRICYETCSLLYAVRNCPHWNLHSKDKNEWSDNKQIAEEQESEAVRSMVGLSSQVFRRAHLTNPKNSKIIGGHNWGKKLSAHSSCVCLLKTEYIDDAKSFNYFYWRIATKVFLISRNSWIIYWSRETKAKWMNIEVRRAFPDWTQEIRTRTNQVFYEIIRERDSTAKCSKYCTDHLNWRKSPQLR